MDIIVTSNERPLRLMATLGSLLSQERTGPWRLLLVDNSEHGLLRHHAVAHLLSAFRRAGWRAEHRRTDLQLIPQLKRYGLSLATSELVTFLDADTVFLRGDTLATMEQTIRKYDVAAVSPLAYDASDERAVLAADSYLYDLEEPDDAGVAEGLTALGLCLLLARSDVLPVMHLWCDELPYFEDQILVHFLKKRRGYAHIMRHQVMHLGVSAGASYEFDDQEILRLLAEKAAADPAYSELLTLRTAGLDGACVRQALRKRSGAVGSIAGEAPSA